MANLRKNIARKRSLEKRVNAKIRNAKAKPDALRNVTVKEKGLTATLEEVKSLRGEYFSKHSDVKPESNPTFVFQKYGKNSVRKFKVV
jgi:hypothetical protein